MNNSLRKILANPGRIPAVLRNRLGWRVHYYANSPKAFKPREIVLYVNNSCNGQCIMCDIGLRQKASTFNRLLTQTTEAILPLETCVKIAEELKNGRPTINIGGVEPLLREDIADMVSIFKTRGFPVKMVTNGWYLPEYAENLARAGLDNIIVSLDGPRSIHDSIRGDGFFVRAMEGIHRFREAQRPLANKMTVSINCCINDKNYHCLAEFAYMMINDVKVDTIRFANLFFISEESSQRHNSIFGELGCVTSTSIHHVDLSAIDIGILWDEFQRLQRLFPPDRVEIFPRFSSKEELRIYYQHPEQLLKNQRCSTPWHSMTIIADGNVIIRNRCIEFSAGNIQQESLESIWNGPRYGQFRRELRKAGLFPACSRC